MMMIIKHHDRIFLPGRAIDQATPGVILCQIRKPHLPFTNNSPEQSLRHWVISRLISRYN